jgi:hypothetical protein
MTSFEIFILFGAGYISGLSISSGFLFQAIRKFNQQSWSKGRGALWGVVAFANIVLCALMPVLLIGIVVVGDEPGRADFWLRAWLFGTGVAAGAALVLFGVRQINKGVRAIVGTRT